MFSVWEYVKDEMQARGWNKYRLAMEMGASEMVLNLCTLDFIETEIKTVPLGHKAATSLGRAFGVSPGLWMKIDENYRTTTGTDAPDTGREPNVDSEENRIEAPQGDDPRRV